MRISDWSSDVCSSDLQTQADAIPAPPPTDVALHQRARAIARVASLAETPVRRWTQRVDAVVLHPVAGFLSLLALMFVMFQAVYAWSEAPIGWITDGFYALQGAIGRASGRERGCQYEYTSFVSLS